MSEFKVGDRVRVLESATEDSVGGELPYETVVTEASDRWLRVRRQDGRGGWNVRADHLELIQDLAASAPTSVFTPYDGWQRDLRHVLYCTSGLRCLTPEHRERLLAAFQPPRCHKRLRNADGSDVQRTVASFQFEPLVCKLPLGHEPPCAPDVPEEEWR